MRKTFFITALLTCSFILNAQVKIKPGIKAGLNISDITNAPSASTFTESSKDFYAGAFLSIRFSKLYALQPEITYSKQGFKLKGTATNDSNNTVNINKNTDLDYLSVALANKFFIKNTGLHAMLGPSVDIRINSLPNHFNNYNFDSDGYTSLDLALFGGVGFEFPFGLTIEARYKYGLIDIEGDNFNQNVNYNQLKLNQVYQIGLAYSF